MKKFYSTLSLFSIILIFGQIPTGYYDSTKGLTGPALKTKLAGIISNSHRDLGYGELYTHYPKTDADNFYEKDGSVLDIYSENPTAADPYNYTHGENKCGDYSVEGDCYNREHIIPQSIFKENAPMVSDLHHVRPTDGKVNGMRSNYPFGLVNSPSYTSANGSKVGNNTSPGYSATVFEPIDQFKGDVARMVFYFVTRYESKLSEFKYNEIITTTAFPGIQQWELALLLQWDKNDPISDEEITRNNEAYLAQGNRNPFIDNKDFATLIWGIPVVDTENPTAPSNLATSQINSTSVAISWSAATDNIGISKYEVFVNGTLYSTSNGIGTTFTISNLQANTDYSIYIVAKDAAGNTSAQSNVLNTKTLEASTNPTTYCGKEDFEKAESVKDAYKTITWTNNNITWTSSVTRTDRDIDGRAIIFRRSGGLSSSTISKGIANLTLTTQLKFTGGTPGRLVVKINGVNKGTIPFSEDVGTFTIENINVEGDFTINIADEVENSENRIGIDNLTWTCYTKPELSVDDNKLQSENLAAYPNPVKHGEFALTGISKSETVSIYSITGQLVKTIPNVKNKEKINLTQLKKGIYIVKAGSQSTKIIVE